MDQGELNTTKSKPVQANRWTALARAFPHLKLIMVIFLILMFVPSTVYFLVARPDISTFSSWGYFGIAALMFICSTTIILPAPGFAAIIAAGGVWNPLLVAIAGAIGAGLGEFSGYLVGLGGENLMGLETHPKWQTLSRLVQKYGFWFILAGAATPSPFDLIGVIAGSTGYPPFRFIAATIIGKTIKYLIFSYSGDITLHFGNGPFN